MTTLLQVGRILPWLFLATACGSADLPVVDVPVQDSFTFADLQVPSAMAVAGRWLWIADANPTAPGLHHVSLSDGPGKWLPAPPGGHAEELTRAPFLLSAGPGASSGAIWGWDLQAQRLTGFQAESTRAQGPDILHLAAYPPLGRAIWLSEEEILGVEGMTEPTSPRFFLYDAGAQLQKTVDMPLLGPDSVPGDVRLAATSGGIVPCAWPGRGFAVINLDFGRIELFDAEGGLVRLADVPYPSEPTFRMNDRGSFMFAADSSHYTDCGVSDDRLLALYSESRNGAAQHVHVFDWSGALISVYHLDRPIDVFAVDGANGTLYGASRSRKQIYVFHQPDPVLE